MKLTVFNTQIYVIVFIVSLFCIDRGDKLSAYKFTP